MRKRTFEIPLTYEQWEAVRGSLRDPDALTDEQRSILSLHVIPRINKDIVRMKEIDEKSRLFIVRLYDGFDHEWIDISSAVSKEEADEIWNKETNNGTRNAVLGDIDYYKIFPADTKMVFDRDGQILTPGVDGG